MNEIINAKGEKWGGKYSRYNKMKGEWHCKVAEAAFHSEMVHRSLGCGHFTYFCMEPTKRRDPSNVTAGAIKLIEDGLQECGVIAGDGWKNVGGIASYWDIDKVDPGVHVFISTDRTLTRDESLLIIRNDANDREALRGETDFDAS